MSQYRYIDYPKLMFEGLRNYLSVTKLYYDEFGVKHGGLISDLFKYCLAITYYLKDAWESFELFRSKQQLIASCNWQYAQLANVLNYLFDPILKRITVSEASLPHDFYPSFAYESTIFAPSFTSESTTYVYSIDSIYSILGFVTINIPSDFYSDTYKLNSIVFTAAQIKVSGIDCQVWDGVNAKIPII